VSAIPKSLRFDLGAREAIYQFLVLDCYPYNVYSLSSPVQVAYFPLFDSPSSPPIVKLKPTYLSTLV